MCGGRERELAHTRSLSRAGTHTARSERERDLAHEVSLRNVRESTLHAGKYITCNTHMHARARARDTGKRRERLCDANAHARAGVLSVHAHMHAHACMRAHARDTQEGVCECVRERGRGMMGVGRKG